MKVVDASALAAMVFGEPEAAEIAEKLSSSALAAPTLLRYELASVGLKKLRKYPNRREALLAALPLADRMGIQHVDVPAVEVLRLADETGLTAYDAAYLWLARHLKAELVTLDQGLKKAARGR